MANYSQSRVVSIRVAPQLLDAVREQARIEGRSVSGEIVSTLKQQLELKTRGRIAPRKISGWLSHLQGPETHVDFRKGRARVSQMLERRMRVKGSGKRGPA
jgi:hypothetical protein